MIPTHSFITSLLERYPAPPINTVPFDMDDILSFEKELGTEMPSDYYDFLQAYGFGSFNDYFYIWNPFTENGTEVFIEEQKQIEENYKSLNAISDSSNRIDCKFSGNELIILNGDERHAKFLRAEKIDEHTRSKILALGNYFPYEFHPRKNGLIYFGRTDDEDFFIHIQEGKISIVMYRDDYFEFDMGITEFIYEYLTASLKLPMGNDETEWNFISFQ